MPVITPTSGYPSPPLTPNAIPALLSWAGRIGDVLRSVLTGKLNVTAPVHINAGVTATTVIDARISINSALLLSPLTANAAAELTSVYVSSQQSGQATFMHAVTANADCNYRMVIIG